VIFVLSHTMVFSSEGRSLLRFLQSLNNRRGKLFPNRTEPMDGLINLDKPPGISSAAAVAKVKRLLPHGSKIGHAGTLDPFATGVLLLLVGRGTKLCESLMDQPKQYEATIKFGATTATDDLKSEEIPWPIAQAQELSEEQIAALLPDFVGTIMQLPPQFSALKVGGRRAYDLARKGQPAPLAERPVRVDSIELLEYQWPFLRLRIDCGRGTYIRSLARDIGAKLNVGGYLTQLRRTKVGPFQADSAVSLPQLLSDGVAAHLKPLPLLL
jgi:tRNA pseudouridine55 synthase